MRRIAAVIALLAAALVVAPQAAVAGGLQRMVSKTGSGPFDVLRMDCPQHHPAGIHVTTAYGHVFGPRFPPSGTGSLRILPAVQKVPGLGLIVDDGNLADVTTFRVAVRNLDSNTLTSTVYVTAGDDWELRGTETAFSPNYATHSILGMTFTWHDITAGTTDTTDGPGTITEFLAAHPQDSAGYAVAMLSGDCAHISTRPVYFDHIDYAETGHGSTRWDFESKTGGLTMAANHSTIAAGGSVRLSTFLRDGGLAVAGATVTLWAKKHGATRFAKVKTVSSTTAKGGASGTLRPTKTTTYQWRFAGSVSTQPTRSPMKIVHVTH